MKVQFAQDIIVQPDDPTMPIRIESRTLEVAFRQWQAQLTRYQKLLDYYMGNQDFGEIHTGLNKIVSNHCRYIVDVLTGYLTGNEPRYNCAEGDAYGQAILDLMREQNKWSIDQQIIEDLGIFGKTYELAFMPADKEEPNSVELDPLHAFVAFSGDMERDSLFGAVVYSYTNDDQQTIYRMYVYDREYRSIWESKNKGSDPRTWSMVDPFTPHGFGRVPLIEYKNNRKAMGDFEGIMELQDAYNSLLSDRQDNQDSFAQAMLVLSGAVIGVTPDEINEGKVDLKKHKVLQLDEDVTAQYLVKTTDETGVQIIQDKYAADIHKMAMVPDLSDEKFAGNASGVAMMYKLFGTDQVVARIMAEFQKGFTRRCKLYDYRLNNPSMAEGYEPRAVIADMTITFNLNEPQDLSYIATALTQLTGSNIISKHTARRLVAVIPDPDAEDELVEEEQNESAERTRDTFDYDLIETQNRALKEPEDAEEAADTEE